jgi:hypothetical protein
VTAAIVGGGAGVHAPHAPNLFEPGALFKSIFEGLGYDFGPGKGGKTTMQGKFQK